MMLGVIAKPRLVVGKPLLNFFKCKYLNVYVFTARMSNSVYFVGHTQFHLFGPLKIKVGCLFYQCKEV